MKHSEFYNGMLCCLSEENLWAAGVFRKLSAVAEPAAACTSLKNVYIMEREPWRNC